MLYNIEQVDRLLFLLENTDSNAKLRINPYDKLYDVTFVCFCGVSSRIASPRTQISRARNLLKSPARTHTIYMHTVQ